MKIMIVFNTVCACVRTGKGGGVCECVYLMILFNMRGLLFGLLGIILIPGLFGLVCWVTACDQHFNVC